MRACTSLLCASGGPLRFSHWMRARLDTTMGGSRHAPRRTHPSPSGRLSDPWPNPRLDPPPLARAELRARGPAVLGSGQRGARRTPRSSRRHLLPRALSRRRRDRHGRDGERPPRPHGRARWLPEVGGDQAHPPAPRRRRPVRRHVPRRGAHRRRHQPRERRPGVRPRQGRQHLLDRHGVPPRRTAPRGDAPRRGPRRAHQPGARRAHLLRRGRGPPRRRRAARQERPAPRSRPPRRHAAQPLPDVRRLHEGRRLRHRQGRRPAVVDARWHAQGQARVHVAGAGARRRGRPHHRHLRARRGPLGDHDQPAPLPHGHRSRHPREGDGLRGHAALDHRPQLPGGARERRHEGARQAQAGPLPDGARVLPRAPAVPRAQRPLRGSGGGGELRPHRVRRSHPQARRAPGLGGRGDVDRQRRSAPRRQGRRRRRGGLARRAARRPSPRARAAATARRPGERPSAAPAASAAGSAAAPAPRSRSRPSRSWTTTRTCPPPSRCAISSRPRGCGPRASGRPAAGLPARAAAATAARRVVRRNASYARPTSPASYAANAANTQPTQAPAPTFGANAGRPPGPSYGGATRGAQRRPPAHRPRCRPGLGPISAPRVALPVRT